MKMDLFDNAILKKIHHFMLNNEQTLAVAESVTAGLVQLSFAQTEMASDFFQGGITVYNIGQKYKHLQVEPIHALQCNCVSLRVTVEMALHVRSLFNSEWGIGITGYATPVPESKNKIFAYYAIANEKKLVAKGKLIPNKKDPFEVQLYYTRAIIKLLNKNLNKK